MPLPFFLHWDALSEFTLKPEIAYNLLRDIIDVHPWKYLKQVIFFGGGDSVHWSISISVIFSSFCIQSCEAVGLENSKGSENMLREYEA